MDTEQNLIKSIAGIALVTGLILLIPLALQLTIGTGVDGQGFNWKPGDFVVMGALLFGTGLAYKLVTRWSGDLIYRIAVGFALFTGLFLIWTNLAVGIIGSEDTPINLFYFGVIVVGLIGALIARFQPDRMAAVMFAMAFAQALIGIIALVGGFYQSPPSTVFHIIGVNGFFITLFVLSALLFRYAAQRGAERHSGDNQETLNNE